MKFTHCLLSALLLFPTANLSAQDDEARGVYFYKNTYTPSALPRFEEAKAELPSPIWDENPEWVELYWKAWEIATSVEEVLCERYGRETQPAFMSSRALMLSKQGSLCRKT